MNTSDRPDEEAIRIGTRASRLAVAQARWVRNALAKIHQAEPGVGFELIRIRTRGDRERSRPLREIGGEGLFTRELEAALLEGRVRLAVHSLKDLPIRQPEGLRILAIPPRAPAGDALITRDGLTLDRLPCGARVGTGSVRRKAQVLSLRPDLQIAPIRGNVDTRLRKLRKGEYDAIVLAQAGLHRLALADEITECLPLDHMLPAPGQGALAIEGRDEKETQSLVRGVHDPDTALAVRAERGILEGLGGGCHLPLAVLGRVEGGKIRLKARVLSPDGKRSAEAESTGSLAWVVKEVLSLLREQGASEILEGPREGSQGKVDGETEG